MNCQFKTNKFKTSPGICWNSAISTSIISSSKKFSSYSQVRYQRYALVLDQLSALDEFTKEKIKIACPEESTGFITRLVNELVEQEWIIPLADKVSFRWNEDKAKFESKKWLEEKLFGNQIKESPERDRPRERLLALGVENLTVSELLAILIRSGRPGESAVTAGQKVANKFNHRLTDLCSAGRGELKSISTAIEKTAFCQIMAGIELGRRIAEQASSRRELQLTSSTDAILFCKQKYERLVVDRKQEEFHIVTLDTKNQVIDCHQITVGTLDASLVHPREVFRAAIKDAAASILLVHNHPSGDPTPSREDISVTRRLESAGELIGIDVLDHVILGNPDAISLREYE